MTIITDIVDAQHLFDTKTGAERDVAKEELLRLQQLLEGSDHMMTIPESTNGRPKDPQDDTVMGENSDVPPNQVLSDGGSKDSSDDTVMVNSDVLPDQVLRTNTDINAGENFGETVLLS